MKQCRLKLSRGVAPFEIYQMVYIFNMLGSSICPNQNQILPFVATRAKIYTVKNVQEETLLKVGLANVF